MKYLIFILIILSNYYSFSQNDSTVSSTPILATHGVTILNQSEKSELLNDTTGVIARLKEEELPQPKLVESEMIVTKNSNEESNPQITKQDLPKPELKKHSKSVKKENKN